MNEMAESISIVNQIINKLNIFKINSKSSKNINISPILSHSLVNYFQESLTIKQKRHPESTTMEGVIEEFKKWTENIKVKSGITYQSIESPKGEFGVTLISDNSTLPFKCKIRSPAYHHLQFLPEISKGHLLADLVALIGTIDIVFGEIDR